MIRLLYFCCFVSLGVQANGLTLNASPTQDNTVFDGFEIEFDDNDGNGQFSLDELISFSGTTNSFVGPTFYYAIISVPETDFTDFSFSEAVVQEDLWYFEGQGPVGINRQSVGSQFWTYRITYVAPVPIPASGIFLASLMGGLVLRRKFASCI